MLQNDCLFDQRCLNSKIKELINEIRSLKEYIEQLLALIDELYSENEYLIKEQK